MPLNDGHTTKTMNAAGTSFLSMPSLAMLCRVHSQQLRPPNRPRFTVQEKVLQTEEANAYLELAGINSGKNY